MECKRQYPYQLYRGFNWVVLGWIVYFLLLPVISPIISAHYPLLWRCPYYTLTGEPCPFCGITRDMQQMYHCMLGYSLSFRDIVFTNVKSLAIVVFVIFQLSMRLFCISRLNLKNVFLFIVLDIHLNIISVVLLAMIG